MDGATIKLYLLFFSTRFDVPSTIIYWDFTSLPFLFHDVPALLIIDKSCVKESGFQ